MSAHALCGSGRSRGLRGWRDCCHLSILWRRSELSLIHALRSQQRYSLHIRAARIWSPETMLLITELYIRFWKRRHRAETPNYQAAFLRGAITGESGGFSGGGGVIKS